MKLPLANHNHNFWDKLKLAHFLLTKRWSMGEKVAELEKKLAEKSEYKYCVATSSGSTANTLAAMNMVRRTEKLPKRSNKVLFCANGWSTTVSPFILAGFEPVFIDSNDRTPTMDFRLLAEYLQRNKVAFVVYTTLLGFQQVEKIQEVCDHFGVDLIIDSCEDTIGIEWRGFLNRLISSKKTSAVAETTSFYLAHEYQACPEMGAIYTNSREDYEYYLCARNHGMIRSIPNYAREYCKANPLVDEKFDFAVVGNNFRPTELSAYAVLLDLKKNQKFRTEIHKQFYFSCSHVIRHFSANDYLFALPLIINKEYENSAEYLIKRIKDIAFELDIETRPIVGGNLLRQTCFQKYGDYKDFPNAEYYHKYGIYIGLYRNMNKKLLFKFRDRIANL